MKNLENEKNHGFIRQIERIYDDLEPVRRKRKSEFLDPANRSMFELQYFLVSPAIPHITQPNCEKILSLWILATSDNAVKLQENNQIWYPLSDDSSKNEQHWNSKISKMDGIWRQITKTYLRNDGRKSNWNWLIIIYSSLSISVHLFFRLWLRY